MHVCVCVCVCARVCISLRACMYVQYMCCLCITQYMGGVAFKVLHVLLFSAGSPTLYGQGL